MEKYYVYVNGNHLDSDGFFDLRDAYNFAIENGGDEIEKMIWNEEKDYQNRCMADNYETVWRKEN